MNFPLFANHLELAHQYWSNFLQKGDLAIDATCGNGHDSLFLAQHILGEENGELYLFDIQQTALDTTKALLSKTLTPKSISRVHFCLCCHSDFSKFLMPATASLIAYNLGYLPTGDKNLTTKTETTLRSLENATEILKPGGIISITCYPGHPEGLVEEQEVLKWGATCSTHEWNCCHHRWINGKKSPSLLLMQKKLY